MIKRISLSSLQLFLLSSYFPCFMIFSLLHNLDRLSQRIWYQLYFFRSSHSFCFFFVFQPFLSSWLLIELTSDFFISSYIDNVFDNISSCYFLHHGDSLGTQIVSHILSESENCHNGAQLCEISLIAKNCMSCLLMWRKKRIILYSLSESWWEIQFTLKYQDNTK